MNEFDKVFQQLESPDYPATCNECGLEGTNASIEEHVCQPSNESPAPRAGEGDVRQWRVSSESNSLEGDATIRAGSEWLGQVKRKYAAQIVTEHNQHTTLLAQRDRLLNALRDVNHAWETGVDAQSRWAHKIRAAIRLTEQEIATVEQEGKS